MKNTTGSRNKRSDYILSIVIFGLVLFGLIMIYSVSKYYSLQATGGTTDKYWLSRQILFVVLGLIVWAVFQAIDYRFWQKNSKYMLYITIGLLLLPIFIGFSEGNTAQRWIGIGSATFQPAEMAKITLIIYLSSWFSKKDEKDIDSLTIPFFVVIFIISLIMLLQKDLGTLAVMLGISAAMFLMSGASYKNMAIGGGLGAMLIYFAIKLEPYRLQRLTAFLNPNTDLMGTGYHIRNALIAIGSGGLFGLGFGQSRQKYLYLPEAHTDSIFAIMAEELGFFRSVLVVLIFGFIALRGYKIAKYAPDRFSSLLAIGITTWFFWQAFINIGAMLSILPLTGVPLPFISYGGSSLLFLLAATGMLINISKHVEYEK